MRISKRRFEKLISIERQKALLQGRKEMMNIVCDGLGRQKAKNRDNPIAFNTLLYAQAHAEGHRLLAYLYDETSFQDAIDFRERFFESRSLKFKKFPTFDRDARLTLIELDEINHEISKNTEVSTTDNYSLGEHYV